jgi:hypothetical protein
MGGTLRGTPRRVRKRERLQPCASTTDASARPSQSLRACHLSMLIAGGPGSGPANGLARSWMLPVRHGRGWTKRWNTASGVCPAARHCPDCSQNTAESATQATSRDSRSRPFWRGLTLTMTAPDDGQKQHQGRYRTHQGRPGCASTQPSWKGCAVFRVAPRLPSSWPHAGVCATTCGYRG